MITPAIAEIIRKLNLNPRLKSFAKTWRGLTTGNDKKFISHDKSDDDSKPLIVGGDVGRYSPLEHKKYVLYIPEMLDRARDERIFLLNEKLISKFVGDRLCFTLDTKQNYVLNSACITEVLSSDIDISFLLGLLNSKLLNFYFSNVFTDYRDSFPLMKSGNIENLPIINANQEFQSEIKSIVSSIRELKGNEKFANAIYLESQIDQLVYELYGLTEEEIAIVEASVK